MSTWTHVNVGIRFDGLPGMISSVAFAPDLGNVCHYKDSEEVWGKCNIPCGSEGSLQFSRVEYGTGLPWLAVHIWGDLRDYSDVDEIITYLNRICNKMMIRDGIGIIEVEGDKTVYVHYDSDSKTWAYIGGKK